jgi:AICAR transformylase/IMP cyclohydrolase PurH
MDITLKYGCNPHQKPAKLFLPEPSPLQILNGTPSYINILDALGAWQLAKELKIATGKPGAASFKHTSPAGAAIARPLSDVFRRSQFLPDDDFSPVTTAYLRARGGDRLSSFGDVAAVSDVVDVSLAKRLKAEVSDLIVAPGFEPEALEILKTKQGGNYRIFQMDPAYEPPDIETRELFGFTLQQKRNDAQITKDLFQHIVTSHTSIPDDILETLTVATIALKYTQSNSVCVAYDGQVIGMGAGQQSRIHCTRLACSKADKWFLQQHPKVLELPFKSDIKKPEKANIVDRYLLWEQLSTPEIGFMLAGLEEKPIPITQEERADWISEFQGVCLSRNCLLRYLLRDSTL